MAIQWAAELQINPVLLFNYSFWIVSIETNISFNVFKASELKLFYIEELG